MRSLFVFRQDLRVQDNIALWHAVQDSKEVIPIFILDTDILQKFPAQDKRLGFLQDCLENLDQELRALGSQLYVYYGKTQELIPYLLQQHNCQALYYNQSYGSGAKHRDSVIQKSCEKQTIHVRSFHDFLLIEPEAIRPYKVYTPFSKQWLILAKQRYSLYQPLLLDAISTPDYEHNNQQAFSQLDSAPNNHWQPKTWKNILSSFSFHTYDDTRNIPSIQGSSKLSVYIRFGLLSIRQLYIHMREQAIIAQEHQLTSHIASYTTYIKELAWREFWQHVAHHFPYSIEQEFQAYKRFIQWEDNPTWFTARCEGRTGYPLVDAGMRQLRQENRMHNRIRMVVASFLTKDMLIDWRLGEKEFARYLLDYDMNVNIGNWQWSASVGADPKPLRIFNPLLQSKRFDPDCIYIKKYVPELRNVPAKKIHAPLTYNLEYARPILDHYVRSKKAKERYKTSRQKRESMQNEKS